MAAEPEVVQYWVRSGKGTVWGPISFATVEMFVENQVISGRVQVSHDGVNFADPGRFLDLRDAFPKEMWGNSVPETAAGTPAVRPGAPGAPPVVGPPVVGAPPASPAPPRAPGAPPTLGPPGTAANPAIPGPPRPRPAPTPSPGAPPTLGPAGSRPSVPVAKPPTLSGVAVPQAPSPSPVAVPVVEASQLMAEAAEEPAPAVAPPPTPAPAAPRAPEPRSAEAKPAIEDVPAEGQLSEELGPIRLYYLLAAQAATGKLTVKSASATFELMMRKGVPHVVKSDQPADSVLTYFGEKGLIKSEGVARAEQAAPQFGGDAVAAAFAQGLISNPGDAVGAIAAHGQSMLKKLFMEVQGSFSYEADVAPPPSSMALGAKWQLLAQAGRTIPVELARERLGERLEMPVMKCTGRVPLGELALNAQEARVASAFEGVKTVTELAASIPGVDEGVVLRTCFLLGELDLASFAAVKKKAAEPPPAPAPAPPAPPPPTPPKPMARPAGTSSAKPGAAQAPKSNPQVKAPASRPAAPVAPKAAAPPPTKPPPPETNDPAALATLVEEMKEQNHFQVLGLTEAANGAQVKAAYLQKVKLYHPDSTPPGAPAQVKDLKDLIFACINEANGVLSDDKERAAYAQDVKDGLTDEKVDVASIFKAEDLFLKATIMLKARKYPEGLAMVEEAIGLNAADGEFYAWRGYGKFMVASDRRAAYAASMAEVEKALKMSQKCASAAYLAGLMSKLVEDIEAARKWFSKALELDPNYADAARELRALR